VNVGDQVTWTNQGKVDHFVQIADEEGVSRFSSGVLIPGDSFSMTFSEPMTYTYVCTTDGSMKGIVTVNP
jgi:plastocyanin